MARPTKYEGQKTIDKANEYIDKCVDEYKSLTDGSRVVYRMKVDLPKAEGLALHLEVRRETLYEWASKYPEFSNILERINQIQANTVINESLAGNYNSTIAKLLLGKHGYKELSGLELEGGEKPIRIEAGVQASIDKIYGKSGKSGK